jgi:hypothetical protein
MQTSSRKLIGTYLKLESSIPSDDYRCVPMRPSMPHAAMIALERSLN